MTPDVARASSTAAGRNITSRSAAASRTGIGVDVAFRAIHSLVHCTYNRVMHRFSAYLVAALALWAMWVRLALAWLA